MEFRVLIEHSCHCIGLKYSSKTTTDSFKRSCIKLYSVGC
jgi:hypothetical protein